MTVLFHSLPIIPFADSSRGGRVFIVVCLSVFPHDILKTDADTKHDVQILFHDESWKSIYFGIKRSKVKITSDENIAGVGGLLHSCECWLLPVLYMHIIRACALHLIRAMQEPMPTAHCTAIQPE